MSQARRAVVGTDKTLVPGVKIGEKFELKANGTAPFLSERSKVFDSLFAKQEEQRLKLVADNVPILVTLPNGKVFDGIAHKTTPMDVAKSISEGLAGQSVVAKVAFSAADTKIVAEVDPEAEEETVDEDEEECCCGNDQNNKEDKNRSPAVLWDMTRELPASCSLELLKFDNPEAKHVFWHSSAHILGQSVENEFGAHLTVGPALQKGFYYDFYVGDEVKITPDHYKVLQSRFESAVKEKQPFQRLSLTKEEALELFQHNPFKVALISSKVPEGSRTSCYRCGSLVDLCMGPHLPHTGMAKAMEIEKHSASYWLGNCNGDSLQRVYAISFPDSKQLKEHIRIVEEAKKRDHRLLGNTMQLFFFDSVYSPGCCFWLPEGARIYNKLCELMRSEYRYRGFHEVVTPNAFSADLFKVSGHYQNYHEDMFLFDVENKEWGLKPMNCPGHCLMFRHMNPSYKQLPIRLADFGVLHRNELSGSLSGLTRVRRFQQDDAHIFARMDQVKQEVSSCLDFLLFTYGIFGFKFSLVLATRPAKAMGEVSLWKAAEKQLAEALDQSNLDWELEKGGGAFYGPKIDIKIQDALERWHQCGTIQLDFQLPLRFNLQYRCAESGVAQHADNEKGEQTAGGEKQDASIKRSDSQKKGETAEMKTSSPEEVEANPSVGKLTPAGEPSYSLEQELKTGFARPVIIHRAILGSLERVTAVLVEHTAGRLPFWLSPRQAVVCPISDQYNEYARYVYNILNQNGFDVGVDDSSNTISKKLRDAQISQWNYMLVIGQQELSNGTVTLRRREDSREQEVLTVQEVLAKFRLEADVTKRRPEDIPPFVPSQKD